MVTNTMLAEKMNIDTPDIDPAFLNPTFLNKVLKPYQPTGTDYLKSVQINPLYPADNNDDTAALFSFNGRFSIPNSCYIKSTGHFNAVEYLICFNQLAYSAFGYIFGSGFFKNNHTPQIKQECKEKLSKLTLELFFKKQLSSMLILKTSTRFKKVIDAGHFYGELSINKFFSRKNTCFADTACIFTDDKGGHAEGEVLLAYALDIGN